MNELTFTLAILVAKELLTPAEAKAIQKASQESVITSNLGEMIAKVNKALQPKDAGEVKTIDAREVMGLK